MPMMKKTVRYSQLSAAATTLDLDVFVADQDYVIRQPILNNVVDFAGGAVSAFTLSFGKDGAETGLVGATNMFTGASNGRANATMGADGVDLLLRKGEKLQVKATSTTANLDALTAGMAEAMWEAVPLPLEQT